MVEMKDQEIRDFLATELMGWHTREDGKEWHDALDRYVVGRMWGKGRIFGWNPLESADDCRACELKIGAMGLGEEYARALYYSQYNEGDFIYNATFKDVYEIITATLKKKCEVMVQVLKERADGA